MKYHYNNYWTGKKDDKIFQKIKQACSRACRKGKSGELLITTTSTTTAVGGGSSSSSGVVTTTTTTPTTTTTTTTGTSDDTMNIDDLIQVEDKREV